MKKFAILLVMVLAFSSCTNTKEETKSSSFDNNQTTVKVNQVEHITATVIRVGRYMVPYNASASGTVLIFDNGQVFKQEDRHGAFACAVKEGDTVTYDRTPDGKITLTGFVVK